MAEEKLSLLDRYEILELIATGGMAQVFRAQLCTPQGTNKEVVVKKLLPHLANNQEFIDMFVDEARISMPLNHANIVQVFDFGQVGDDFFMVMEYVDGHNLENILIRTRTSGAHVPLPACIFIASEIAKGLDYAHLYKNPKDQNTGIIHRDISPQNIMVGFDGNVKLTDFGIAKAKNRIHQTRHGIIRGKACYLSPEQATCVPLDNRSDQFSLAVVLFEMLTGVRPFEGDSELETLEKVRNAKTQIPSTLRPEIPPELDQAMMKALSLNPADRYENIETFQSSLYGISRKLASDFSSFHLSTWMKGLISPNSEKANSKHQVAQKRTPLNTGSSFSRDEILSMNTVAIRKDPPEKLKPSNPRTFLPLLLILLLSIGTASAVWIAWPKVNGLFDKANPDSKNLPDIVDNDASDISTKVEAKPIKQSNSVQIKGNLGQKPKPIEYGTLHLNAYPWALVELDGKQLEKHTPLFNIRVRAGKHSLRFFNPEIKLEKTVSVRVLPERSKTVSVRLTDP